LPFTSRLFDMFSAPMYIKPGSALEIGFISESAAVGGCPFNVGLLWDEI
jgi:hypothetical protein